MTEHSAVTGVRGRGGIVSLVESTLALDRAAERPLTMLLGPRGSGTSELLCVLMEQFGSQYPFGYVKFTSGQELLPRYALGLLARQLARDLPSYRHTAFPRLALGLLASDQDLPHQALTGGQRGIRGALAELEKRAKHRHGDYLAAYLTVAQASIDAPEGASRSARTLLSAATDTSARSWAGRWDHSAAAWFGQHRLTHSSDPWESLLELNRWRHQGDERDKLRLDQLLCSAFLEDLRTSVKGLFRPRSYLLLLDETHTDHGREFLDLLLQARHDDTVLGRRPCDPLSVVAGCNRWLPRWGPATGEEWPWQPREPDRASLADWHEHRPSGDGQDTWWYPLRMRDLDRDEVRIHVEQQLNTHPELTPFTTLARSSIGSPAVCPRRSSRSSKCSAGRTCPRCQARGRTSGCATCRTVPCRPGDANRCSWTPRSTTCSPTSTPRTATASPNVPPPTTCSSARSCSAAARSCSPTSAAAGC